MIQSNKIKELIINKTIEWFEHFPEENDIVSNDYLIKNIIFIHYCNFIIWDRENNVRDTTIDADMVVRIKNEIDIYNLKRADLIENIDEHFISELKLSKINNWLNLYINSQTLGQIIDRISILCLKYFFIKLQSEVNSNDLKNTYTQNIESIEEQLRYICLCFDKFFNKLKKGKAYMMPYKQYKMYDKKIHNIKDNKDNK